MQNFSMIAKPCDLLLNNVNFQFEESQRFAFQILRDCITERRLFIIYRYGEQTVQCLTIKTSEADQKYQ